MDGRIPPDAAQAKKTAFLNIRAVLDVERFRRDASADEQLVLQALAMISSRTMQKVLTGQSVRRDVLIRLGQAAALSNFHHLLKGVSP